MSAPTHGTALAHQSGMVFRILLLVVLLVGCSREQIPTEAAEGEIAGTALSDDVNPIAAQSWIDDVRLGVALGPDGSIGEQAERDMFTAGDPILVSMSTKDAPPAAAVRVVWMTPDGNPAHEEEKSVSGGQEFLSFEALDTSRWPPGEYRVEVWVGDERVDSEPFHLVPARRL